MRTGEVAIREESRKLKKLRAKKKSKRRKRK